MGGLLTVEGIKHKATLIGIILIVITNAVSRKLSRHLEERRRGANVVKGKDGHDASTVQIWIS